MDKDDLLGHGSFCLDEDAMPDTLLNDAAEWLQYARGLTDLLTELVTEEEIPHRRRLLLALGAISTLLTMSVQCAAQAHAKMQWDKV